MALDTNIPLQVQTPKLNSPLDAYANALSLKSAMQESQVRDLQYKQTLKAFDADEQFKNALSNPDSYEKDPLTGAVVPKEDVLQKLYSIDPAKAQALQKNIYDSRKTAIGMQKEQLETSSKKLDMLHSAGSASLDKYDELIGQGVPPQIAAQQVEPIYQNSIKELSGSGAFSPQELQSVPKNFDPQKIQAGLQSMIPYKDRIAQKQKQLEDAEKARHNVAEEQAQQQIRAETASYHAQELKRRDKELGIQAGRLGVEQGRLGVEKEKLDLTKSGKLDDDTIKEMAAQYRAGDKSVMQNLGRGAQGAENIVKLRKEISNQMKDAGESAKDIASTMAEFEGQKAGQRALGTRSAQVDLAVTEAQRLVPLALEASEKFDRTGYKTLNDIQIAVDKGTASPELRSFVAANNSLVNVYARAIAPVGSPAQKEKDHAREVLDVSFSKGDYRAGVEQLQKEMEAAQLSPRQVKKDMRADFTDKPREAEKTKPAEQKATKKLVYDPKTGTFK